MAFKSGAEWKGNAKGRPKIGDAFGEIVRSKKGLPYEIFKTVYDLMKNSDDDDLKLKSAIFLKEAGWGKPAQVLMTTDEDGKWIPYSVNIQIDPTLLKINGNSSNAHANGNGNGNGKSSGH